jgi:uncharacterized phiE125 gp8 family phage protein
MSNEYQVRVYTAPAVEPVSLEMAKLDLRVDHDDDDALIADLIVACRQEAEDIARRAFVNRTLDLSLSGWPADGKIRLPYPPAVSVTSVTYYKSDNTTGTMPSTDYVLVADIDPAVITTALNKSWPTETLRTVAPVRVRYVAGYGETAASVPERYRSLIRSLVLVRYESRDELTASQERQLQNIRAALKMEWGW